jgi:hypothetical protein
MTVCKASRTDAKNCGETRYSPGHNFINRVGRTLHHQGIVNRSHDVDASVRRQATRQPHHLGPARLAWEIPERTRVGVGANADRPAENGLELVQQHRMRLGPVRPSPECGVRLPMEPEQVATVGRRLADPGVALKYRPTVDISVHVSTEWPCAERGVHN